VTNDAGVICSGDDAVGHVQLAAPVNDNSSSDVSARGTGEEGGAGGGGGGGGAADTARKA
jgi:hypothetical protein